MKTLILVLQMCSTIDGSCSTAINHQKVFNNYPECAIYGYFASAEYLMTIDVTMINEQKLAVRFWCKESNNA